MGHVETDSEGMFFLSYTWESWLLHDWVISYVWMRHHTYECNMLPWLTNSRKRVFPQLLQMVLPTPQSYHLRTWVYVCVCVCVSVRVHANTTMLPPAHVCVCVCVCACKYAYPMHMCVCDVCVYVCVRLSVSVHACMYRCMFQWINACMHTKMHE